MNSFVNNLSIQELYQNRWNQNISFISAIFFQYRKKSFTKYLDFIQKDPERGEAWQEKNGEMKWEV